MPIGASWFTCYVQGDLVSMRPAGVARLDNFWNFLDTNFIAKETQMFCDFWAFVKTTGEATFK